ncbi:MAG: hypothetical protein RLZZ245_3104 [Verrucomicrobiota bacterium]
MFLFKTQTHPIRTPVKSKPNLFARVSPVLAAIAMLASVQSLQAASLTWDTTSGDSSKISAGGGICNLTTGNLVWNKAGANPNLAWTQTTTTTPLQIATFARTNTGTNAFTPGNFDLVLASMAGTQIVNFGAYAGSGFTTINPRGLAGGLSAMGDASNRIMTVIPEPSTNQLPGSLGTLLPLGRRC